MNDRHYDRTDHFLIQLDQMVQTLFGTPRTTGRPNPAAGLSDTRLTPTETDESIRLMRIDHTGEICAQALYQGQALTTNLPEVREKMAQAAREENDHLAWCEQRLDQLGGRKSLLNPLWYLGSLTLGAAAGWAGDRWSLGFVAETERQVENHLADHMNRLGAVDPKSQAILEQMQRDEVRHAEWAEATGGTVLPEPIRLLMRTLAKVMTTTVYWI
ncbi:MAG: 2-polyprenyl-3-methyl-6-methoxy-1,4-benzoquinone monooxygenase [Pseudomonadota bacterium]